MDVSQSKLCALMFPLLAGQAAEMATLVVGLDGPPVAELTTGVGSGGVARAGLARAMAVRRAEIAAQHDEVRARLASLGAEVVSEHDTLVNALVVRVPADRVAEVGNLAGVVRVRQFTQLFSAAQCLAVPYWCLRSLENHFSTGQPPLFSASAGHSSSKQASGQA